MVDAITWYLMGLATLPVLIGLWTIAAKEPERHQSWCGHYEGIGCTCREDDD